MDVGTWEVTVHGVIKNQTGLNDSHFTFFMHPVSITVKALEIEVKLLSHV